MGNALIISYWLGQNNLYKDVDVEDLERIVDCIEGDFIQDAQYVYIGEYLLARGVDEIVALVE